jgi:protein-S-isoprenylcysteine O-methyltransferase Ste14
MVKESTKTANGCVLLFLSVFVVAGLAALSKGIYTYSQHPEFTEEVIAMLGVGGMFTLIGGAFMAALLFGRKKVAEEDIQKEKHPDAP